MLTVNKPWEHPHPQPHQWKICCTSKHELVRWRWAEMIQKTTAAWGGFRMTLITPGLSGNSLSRASTGHTVPCHWLSGRRPAITGRQTESRFHHAGRLNNTPPWALSNTQPLPVCKGKPVRSTWRHLIQTFAWCLCVKCSGCISHIRNLTFSATCKSIHYLDLTFMSSLHHDRVSTDLPSPFLINRLDQSPSIVALHVSMLRCTLDIFTGTYSETGASCECTFKH